MSLLLLIILGAALYIWAKVASGLRKEAEKRAEGTVQIHVDAVARTFADVNFSGHLQGIHFKNTDGSSRQDILRRCLEASRRDPLGREEVELIREPNNSHDKYAIRICRMNGEQLGYWRGRDQRLCERIDSGQRLRATISEIYEFDDKPGEYGAEILVEVLE